MIGLNPILVTALIWTWLTLGSHKAQSLVPYSFLSILTVTSTVYLHIGIKIPVSNLYIKNEYAFPWDHSICIKKRTVMAAISTLFYGRLWVWPIVMIVLTEIAEKYRQLRVFDFVKENWTRYLYLIISFKRLNEITSFVFCWKGNII